MNGIHKYPEWSKEVKSIYDSFPNLRIIASGSSAMEIYKGSHDLSRRAIQYQMPGLSLREYVDLSQGGITKPLSLEDIISDHERASLKIIESLEKYNKKILSLFKDYLQFGYFPYFHEYNDISLYYITLEQGIHTIIESDLLAIYPTLNGTSIKMLKRLLAVIAESVPFTPDLKKLKKIVEIADERTLKNYLHYLDIGGVISCLYKKGGKLRSMEKPAKIYLNNPNQVYAISGKGRENITVWASFDGGKTWPIKRRVYDGPSAYSNLAAGRDETPSEGKLYILFEGGPEGMYSAIQVAVFNLNWVIKG